MAKTKHIKQPSPVKNEPATAPGGKREKTIAYLNSFSSTQLILFVLCASFICLIPVLQNDFLAFDDPAYVTENPIIKQLNMTAMKAFFSREFVGTYQPVVMLCYAIEYKLFGLNATWFHLFSLAMHLLNIGLVFLLTERLLKNRIATMITALLFGIHPLHVESVAWVASQKDVIYAFFFLAAGLCYLKFIQDGNKKYHFFSLLLFIVSLFSKQQAVVLPVVLLLFDFLLRRKITGKVIVEKLPFFALSLIMGAVAFYMQQKVGAIQDFGYFPFYERALFASYGFVCYLLQTVVPIHLSIFYPYPETLDKINSPFVYVAPFVIAALAALLFIYGRRQRVLVFATLFFCVTIFLVIQLIPVGTAVRADRYSYVSLIGIFILAGYVFATLYEKQPARQKMLTILAGCYFAVIGILSFSRTLVFKDSLTVYNDALENYPSFMIYNNRGAIYFNNKQYQDALNDFQEVEKIKPAFPGIWFNSGYAWQKLGNFPKAIEDYKQALQKDSSNAEVYIQLQTIHSAQNDLPAALIDITKILALRPSMTESYYVRAGIYGRLGKTTEAIADLDKVLALNPNFTDAYNDRGIANSMAGNSEKALLDFNKALQLKPDAGNTYFNRSLTLKALDRFADAYNDAVTAGAKGYAVNEQYLQDLKIRAGK